MNIETIVMKNSKMEMSNLVNAPFINFKYNSQKNLGASGNFVTEKNCNEIWKDMQDNKKDSNLCKLIGNSSNLKKILDASQVTKCLNTGNISEQGQNNNFNPNSNEIEGIVKLKRALENGSILDLKYISDSGLTNLMNKYMEEKTEEAKLEALKHFTIENLEGKVYAKVPIWSEKIEKIESNDPRVGNKETKDCYMFAVYIEYEKMLDKFEMFFDFIIALLENSGGDKELVDDLLNLVYESDIEITIFDSVIKEILKDETSSYTVKDYYGEGEDGNFYKREIEILLKDNVSSELTKADIWNLTYTRGYSQDADGKYILGDSNIIGKEDKIREIFLKHNKGFQNILSNKVAFFKVLKESESIPEYFYDYIEFLFNDDKLAIFDYSVFNPSKPLILALNGNSGEKDLILEGMIPYEYLDKNCPQKGKCIGDPNINAYVYLPPNYNENQKYDVIYLYHGKDDAPYYLTTKNMTYNGHNWRACDIYDHMIYSGKSKPFIVVSCPYSEDQEGKQLREKIIPYVAENYSTYSKSGNIEDIKEAKNHIAIGGFSRGGHKIYNNIFSETGDICGNYLLGDAGSGNESSYNSLKNKFKDEKFNYIYATSTQGVGQWGKNCFDKLINSSNNLVENQNAKHDVIKNMGHTYETFMTSFWNGMQYFFPSNTLNEVNGDAWLDYDYEENTIKHNKPELIEPESTEPEPTKPEPTEPEPTEPKPTEPEPTEPEPTEPEPTEPEPIEPEPIEPEKPDDTRPNKPVIPDNTRPNKPVIPDNTRPNKPVIPDNTRPNSKDILQVAKEVHDKQLNWNYYEDIDELENKISNQVNNKNRVTSEASYIATVLYEANEIKENELNKVNFNNTKDLIYFLNNKYDLIYKLNKIKEGDIVIIKNRELNKLLIRVYVGNNQWYSAENDNFIKSIDPIYEEINVNNFYYAFRINDKNK